MSGGGSANTDCCDSSSPESQQQKQPQQRQQPEDIINQEKKSERSTINEAALSYDANNCQVRVGVRIRPRTSTETSHGGKTVVFANDIHRTISIGKKQERTFTYDMVFDPNVNQTLLYDRVKGQLLGAFLDGYNATIMAYGQTGSGKTYTMGSDSHPNLSPADFNRELGNTTDIEPLQSLDCEKEKSIDELDWESYGLIPRFMADMFAALDQMLSTKDENGPTSSFQLTASFIEVYGEDVYDLLSGDRKSLPIREDSSGTVMVVGLSQCSIHTASDALSVLQRGTLHRTTASTLMNQCSSRSHAVFTIWLQRTTVTARSSKASNSESLSLDVTTSSRLTFVDLAGSERMKKTGAEGERAKEGIKINEGLLALGNVINALADEDRLSKGTKPIHVPYRQTKLTRLLQDALGGNSQTLFLACVSPSDTNVSETLSTLQYANRARNIKNVPTKNVDGAILELQRLNALTNVLQSELIKHRFGGYHYRSPLLPIRLDEEEEEEIIADSFVMEDLMQRQDVQEYLRDIYQIALQQKPATIEGLSVVNFMETAVAAPSTAAISSNTSGPSHSRVSNIVLTQQLSSTNSRPLPAPASLPSATMSADASRELPRSSIPPLSSTNDEYEMTALLEVNPNEDLAIVDQLLELQQHTIEFNSAQKEEQKLLKDVEGELKQKEDLLLQLRHSLEIYHDMKIRYEALLAEVQSLESEKSSLTEQLVRALQDPAKGCSVAIKKKLELVEQTLVRTRNETKKHQQLYRKAEQEAKKCQLLERKITELKQSKVALIRKQREAAAKHKEYIEQKTREIQSLKKKERKNEQQLSKLELECRHHKVNLERRKIYGDKLSLKLKETETHLMKLLTMRKKEVQERTKTLQSSTRTSNRFSGSFLPYKSLRANGAMQPLTTDHEGDEEKSFAPLNEETASVVFLLNRLISDKVAQAYGRRRYEEHLVEYSNLMKQLMEEVKFLNELRKEEIEIESPSDEILDHEKNVEDLELRIELMGSNLDDLRSKLDLGVPGAADSEDVDDPLSSTSSEINLISSSSAPVVRTVLWEIVRAFSNSQLEIRVLEESLQRKEAAIKGLEQETDVLSRQLNSVSKDYNELRESQIADHAEFDRTFRLNELEKKVSSLKLELEQKCQEELSQSTALKQLKVCLGQRERELAHARENLALQEAARSNLDKNVEASNLLSNVQSIWEELGVSMQDRDIARGKIDRCLEDTCNRMLEDATAQRRDTRNRIDVFANRFSSVVSALGIDHLELVTESGAEGLPLLLKVDDYKKKLRRYQHSYESLDDSKMGSGNGINAVSSLQKLDEYERKLAKLQPRYDAAKERRDKLALDVINILKAMACLEDGLSVNLKKLQSDYNQHEKEDEVLSHTVQSTSGASGEAISAKKSTAFSSEVNFNVTNSVVDGEEAKIRLNDFDLTLEKNTAKAESPNSLSDAFLDACEADIKTLRLRKREILIGNNELCEKTRFLVSEMHVSPKEILSICTRFAKKRSQQLPDWWDSQVAFAVCKTLSQNESIVGVSELYTKHLLLMSEMLQIVSVGRNGVAGSLRLIIENARNILLSTLEDDVDAKEAYTSVHEALFRPPKMSKDHIQACIDELHVLVNAAEVLAESETEALAVVWEALNVPMSEREQFWTFLEESMSSLKTRIDSSFDNVLSSGSSNLEEWIYMIVKDAIKANRLLDLKLFKLQTIHAEVEEKREKQDLKSKIITVDSEIRMISARLAEFEEMAGNTQRLVTKKINSSNFLKEERFRKNVQSKFASKLEGLGKLLQEWQRKEVSTFDSNLLSEDVQALVVNLDGFDAWVEQRTAFMHLKTVKPKVSARKGIVIETEASASEDGSSVPPELHQPLPPPRSKIRNNSSNHESWSRGAPSATSSSSVRGVSNVSALSSGSTKKTLPEPTAVASTSSSSRNTRSSPSSLQQALKNVRSEKSSSKDVPSVRTPGYDPKRTAVRQRASSPGKFRSKSSPAKTKALKSDHHKSNVENRSPKGLGSSSLARSRSPSFRTTGTPKRIVIGSSNNAFGHVLTHEST